MSLILLKKSLMENFIFLCCVLAFHCNHYISEFYRSFQGKKNNSKISLWKRPLKQNNIKQLKRENIPIDL